MDKYVAYSAQHFSEKSNKNNKIKPIFFFHSLNFFFTLLKRKKITGKFAKVISDYRLSFFIKKMPLFQINSKI